VFDVIFAGPMKNPSQRDPSWACIEIPRDELMAYVSQ